MRVKRLKQFISPLRRLCRCQTLWNVRPWREILGVPSSEGKEFSYVVGGEMQAEREARENMPRPVDTLWVGLCS